MKARAFVVAFAWSLTLPAFAQNTIREWSGVNSNKYEVDQVNRTVTILTSAATEFHFEVFDSTTGAPGIINRVSCDTNDAVALYIAADPNSTRTYGAQHIHEIDLSASSDGDIRELTISGNLGLFGPTLAHRISGPVMIDGSTFFEIAADEISGTITVGGDAIIEAGSLGAVMLSGAGNHQLGVHVYGPYSSVILVNGTVNTGSISVNGNFSGLIHCTGSGGVRGDFLGQISVGGDFLAPGRIVVRDLGAPADPDGLFIAGSITGTPGDYQPLIDLSGDLRNTLLISGSLTNVCVDTSPIPEIRIAGTLDSAAAIAIDYDGEDFADSWHAGATIEVDSTAYGGNTPAERIYEITACLGDMNNDGVVDEDDLDAFELFVGGVNDYEDAFPGLGGSVTYHADCDRDGIVVSASDEEVLEAIVGESNCCIPDCANIDGGDDLNVGLSDLALLLGAYGTLTGASRHDGDIEPPAHFGDDDVDVGDLALMLAEYGSNCFTEYCTLSFGGEGFTSEPMTLEMTPVDTEGYIGGGFAGEDTHFVFDVVVTVSDSGDDWTTCALLAETSNGAVFRLAPDPNGPSQPPPTPGTGEPQEYATFLSVPKAVASSGRFTSPFSVGGIAGAYSPADPQYTFSTEAINAAWFDFSDASHDGPAAVMRVALDVTSVAGANTSGGLGSVYFSTTGPADPADIPIATFELAATCVSARAEPTHLTGEFFVTGS